ncbi:sulfurtransferase TusA family protein [Arenibaculum pallidiluteum]|uniref:sulfurtransferase TusA family protein n=1 Tax=Arenibaculum pallidiluteum TaxID=2812559 RepID=UPI001A960DE9|nr:sulfurtransferase TusA family protein [Arenibaculum pallidiluteum]
MNTHLLDAKGLACPLPVLRARKLLKALAPGEILDVEATDPGAPKDFRAFCEASGNRLLLAEETGGIFRFRIERGG